MIEIADGIGIALENLSVIGSAGGAGSMAAITARNVIDLRVEHINVLDLAAGDSTSVAIGLAGYLLGASIVDCALVAERGIARLATGANNYLLTGELCVARNVFFCTQLALSLDDQTFSFGSTRVGHNLMLGASQAAVVATGAVLAGSAMTIADNVIYTSGQGIRAGVNGLAIERNEIAGLAGSGDGIVLTEGLDPLGLDHVRVCGNRLRSLGGNGIVINHAIDTAIIADNMIDGMGLGALVMGEGGTAAQLSFAGNQCVNLGQALANANAAFAAVQLIRIERGDVLDNVFGNIGRQAVGGAGIDALRAVAVGQLRVAGNRMYGIGPLGFGAPVTGVRLPPPFDRVALDDNSIDRRAAETDQLSPLEWRSIDIAPEAVGAVTHFAAASYFAFGESAVLLNAFRAVQLPAPRPAVSIRGNHLRGHFTTVPLNRCAAVSHCVFAENHCELLGASATGQQSLLGTLAARTLNACNNRLIGFSDLPTLILQPQIEQAIVMGNTSTGPIVVQGGTPVPPDILLTNIFGA